jgi:hypothetical protein
MLSANGVVERQTEFLMEEMREQKAKERRKAQVG